MENQKNEGPKTKERFNSEIEQRTPTGWYVRTETQRPLRAKVLSLYAFVHTARKSSTPQILVSDVCRPKDHLDVNRDTGNRQKQKRSSFRPAEASASESASRRYL